ncbi:hypothetical protein [Legionella israelensis]|uniref:Secreted endonuclease n=1 Tax=Legionella israelensis TaxID=454 RepID=A0A0W0VH78_9GAMM|nr:hypothetical protein [Legionella israelensis]KTD19520.1 secreted endonuclease [Legionella israelensis]QBS08672.1 hypothetical protein E4T55_01635 [Legionella israelensis]SCY38206.1 hypothetical protein SAMN02746069_02255 [Legionella israelensis DSM 19235]STX58338.1 secreted endonuclease [Legionella israelensis]
MKRHLIISLLALIMTACAVKDKQYYQAHPEELQKALMGCPNQSPRYVSCSQLKSIALTFNELASQLQANPQKFGNKILELQQQIAQKKEQLKNNPENKQEIQDALQKKQQELADRLIMVKLFESPER